MKKTAFFIILLIFYSSCSAGINSIVKDLEEIENSNRLEKLKTIIEKRCPEYLKITERAVITYNEKQYDFIIYTAFISKDLFRTVFLTDMGNTVIDFIYSEGNVNIITNIAGIPENFIKNGFCSDLKHVNCSIIGSVEKAALYTDNSQNILFIAGGCYKELFYFNNDYNIEKSVYSKSSRIISSVKFETGNLLNNFVLDNYRYNYNMRLIVLNTSHLENPDTIFNFIESK